jgi:hypothetical protein
MIPRWRAYLALVRACWTPFVWCLDRRYRPLEPQELAARLRAFPPWRYAPEVNDCDDAAHALRAFVGHGVGIALSHRHAWNVALCHDGVWHIEPQNGRLTRRKWALVVVL